MKKGKFHIVLGIILLLVFITVLIYDFSDSETVVQIESFLMGFSVAAGFTLLIRGFRILESEKAPENGLNK